MVEIQQLTADTTETVTQICLAMTEMAKNPPSGDVTVWVRNLDRLIANVDIWTSQLELLREAVLSGALQ